MDDCTHTPDDDHLTNADVWNAGVPLNELASRTDLPGKVLYRIGRSLRAFRPVLETLEETRRGLVKKHTQTDAGGAPIPDPTSETNQPLVHENLFQEEFRELLLQPCEDLGRVFPVPVSALESTESKDVTCPECEHAFAVPTDVRRLKLSAYKLEALLTIGVLVWDGDEDDDDAPVPGAVGADTDG